MFDWFYKTTLFGWPLPNIVFLVTLCFAFIVVILTAVAYTTLFERKVISLLQVRNGPNRAGPLGLFQPIADGVKLFFKEDLIPDSADKVLNILAPALAMFAALLTFAVIPFGPVYDIPGFGKIPLFIADMNGMVARTQTKKKRNPMISNTIHHGPGRKPKGPPQPPRKRVAAMAETAIMEAYSESIKTPKRRPEYSVWKPPVSSVSASTRSKGGRLVSANMVMT